MAEATSAAPSTTAPATAPTSEAPATSGAPAAPKLDLKLGAPAGTPETKTETPVTSDAELVKQMAKASAAERKANAMVSELKKQLEAATGSSTEAQQKAALWDSVTKNPRLLLDHGVTWDQILTAVSGQEEEAPDPKHEATKAELKKLQDRIDAKEKAEKEAKDAAEKAEYDAANARVDANIKGLIDAEGAKPDKDGYPRWAIISQDPGKIAEVKAAAIEHIEANNLQLTLAEALEVVAAGLDQYEAHERGKLTVFIKATDRIPVEGIESPSKPTIKTRPELPADRYSIDDSTRGTPPPAGLSPVKTDRPRTRAASF